MTASEITESSQISRQLQDIEFRLSYWRKNLEACEAMVKKIEEKQSLLLIRQKDLIAGKSDAASG